ncbi:MAG TPA: GH92 family glycosyl hydrolase, partial [Chloroflexota bacterium]
NTEVQGSATSGFFCGASDSYTVHFDITFDHPFTASQVINEPGQPGPNSVVLTFDTTTNHVLQAKVGISFVSAANAKDNVQTDNPGWNFDAVRTAAHDAWNALLNKIQIGGSTTDREQLFYTSLYHTLLHPNVWSDADGQYMGFDQQVHTTPAGHAQYANYSGWDTYHSQSQLAALLAPQQTSDQVTSLLNDDAQSGVMPQWGFANSNNYVMVGDPAQAIIADTYAFGGRSFDTSTALTDMLKQATTVNDVRPGTALENQYGYLPEDGTYGCCNPHGFAASLLEYNQADFALAQYAGAMGDSANATMLTKRAQNWQNIFNPADNFMETKYSSGQFAGGYTLTSSQGLVEGSASQYRWIVPYNHESLIAAMGGDQQVNPMLDAFFTNLDDGSGVGALLTNEFEMGVQYFYDYTREPWKTQEVVNRMRTQVFHDAPMFTDNNDDLGAMSSQLAWGMLGFYPEVPGSAQLVLNGPEFPVEVIHLNSGNTITVNAPGASTSSFYIQSLKVNGHPSTQLWLDPSLINTGGTLDLTMGASPNTSWGTAPQDAPPSYGTQHVSAIGFATPAGQIILQPGGSGSATVGAQSTWTSPQTISWTATPSSGVTVSPSSGSFNLNQGGRRSVPVTITAGQTEGRYTVSFQLTSSTGLPISRVVLGVVVAKPGELWPYYNNVGIADDSNTGAANYDGDGFSYSAQALAAGAPTGVTPGSTLTTSDGFSYTWPNVPSGQLDNIQAAGQTITLNPTSGKSAIGLLGSATNVGMNGSQGTLTVNFSDGTSQQIPVTLSDWTLGAGSFGPVAGNVKALTTSYRDCIYGQPCMDGVTTYVYSLSASLTPGKTVVSVTLPSTVTDGQFHIFDLAFK